MRVRAGARTDIGRVREGNEDSFVADEPLYAVADGMGGHRGGEVASRLAIETLETLFRKGRGAFAEQVREANRAVFERSMLDRAVAGMGTTLTAAAVEPGRVRLVHVGDSRAYLFREGLLRLLTEDHTVVHEMVQRDEITAEEAEVHPHRSILTRALGTEPDVVVDEHVVETREADRLLLCSDGLTTMLSDDEVAGILRDQADPQAAADELVRAANAAGGIDNITALVLDVEADDAPASRADASAPATAVEPRAEGRGAAATSAAVRPSRKPRREPSVRWGHLLVRVGAAALVAALGVAGARLWLDAQWYVGVSNGRVAVFRGVPTEVAGFELHEVVVETEIPAAEAKTLPFYADLDEGITAGSREEADAIVEQIRADLEESTLVAPGEETP